MRGTFLLAFALLACGSGPDSSFPPGSGAGGEASAPGTGGAATGGAVNVGSTGGHQSGGAESGGANSGGTSTTCINRACTSENDCCPGTVCYTIGDVGRCLPFCATDADCSNGWGCIASGDACGGIVPAFACKHSNVAGDTPFICSPPCKADADCGRGLCATFWNGEFSLGGPNGKACPLSPRDFCGSPNLQGAVLCPG